jgi:hypothetical protein
MNEIIAYCYDKKTGRFTGEIELYPLPDGTLYTPKGITLIKPDFYEAKTPYFDGRKWINQYDATLIFEERYTHPEFEDYSLLTIDFIDKMKELNAWTDYDEEQWVLANKKGE